MGAGRQATFSLRQGIVMPGLVPGIHAEPLAQHAQAYARSIRVDGRDKPGHDSYLLPALARKDS